MRAGYESGVLTTRHTHERMGASAKRNRRYTLALAPVALMFGAAWLVLVLMFTPGSGAEDDAVILGIIGCAMATFGSGIAACVAGFAWWFDVVRARALVHPAAMAAVCPHCGGDLSAMLGSKSAAIHEADMGQSVGPSVWEAVRRRSFVVRPLIFAAITGGLGLLFATGFVYTAVNVGPPESVTAWVFLVVPIGLIALGAFFLRRAWLLLRTARVELREDHRLCPGCAYDLRGHPVGEPCPECGAFAEGEAAV